MTKEEKKKELARRFIIKDGHGIASNFHRSDSSKYAPTDERIYDGNWKNLCFWYDWFWETSH